MNEVWDHGDGWHVLVCDLDATGGVALSPSSGTRMLSLLNAPEAVFLRESVKHLYGQVYSTSATRAGRAGCTIDTSSSVIDPGPGLYTSTIKG